MKKALLAAFSSFLIFVLWFFSIGVGDYPALDSCFKTTVSKKLLCAQNPDYVRLDEISGYFLKAVVMSEDDKFYDHDGFDWTELKRSMAANFRQFAFVRGGSTITQQLVKNVYLNREKTISRKVVEAKLAKRIEQKHSKKLILEKYVNAIEYGKDLWGVKQASMFYFKKSPSLLKPIESVYLVVLLPSPVKYSKTFFKKELTDYQKKRMLSLLRRMKKRKVITFADFEEAKIELNYFLKDSNEQEFNLDPIEVDELEEADVTLPEEDEMSGTDPAPNPSEDSYSEEDGVVEDDDPDLDLDSDENSEEEVDDQP